MATRPAGAARLPSASDPPADDRVGRGTGVAGPAARDRRGRDRPGRVSHRIGSPSIAHRVSGPLASAARMSARSARHAAHSSASRAAGRPAGRSRPARPARGVRGARDPSDRSARPRARGRSEVGRGAGRRAGPIHVQQPALVQGGRTRAMASDRPARPPDGPATVAGRTAGTGARPARRRISLVTTTSSSPAAARSRRRSSRAGRRSGSSSSRSGARRWNASFSTRRTSASRSSRWRAGR